MKFKTHLSISLLSVVALSIGAIIATTAIEPPGITIDTESVYYKLNEEGLLTIQITGKMGQVSQAECESTLSISETFPIATLSDGSPVLEMSNDEAPLIATQDGDDFQLVFGVLTRNTTNLPTKYALEISSDKINLKETIIPKWPPLTEGGGGAAIDCYISSFWAYDTTKGSTVHVVTYIYNPNFLESDAWGLKFLTSAFNYTDWTDQWTPNYNGGNINPYSTLVVHSYLQKTFTAQSSNKKYAFNTGDFRVTCVYAEGDTWGDPWSDTYDPTATQGQFQVSVESGTHPVFVVHLVDSYFKNSCSNYLNWFDHIETKEYDEYLYGSDTTLKTQFALNFHSLVFTWNPSSDDISYLYNQIMRPTAKNLLGLSNDWKQDPSGTQTENHDLICFLPTDID